MKLQTARPKLSFASPCVLQVTIAIAHCSDRVNGTISIGVFTPRPCSHRETSSFSGLVGGSSFLPGQQCALNDWPQGPVHVLHVPPLHGPVRFIVQVAGDLQTKRKSNRRGAKSEPTSKTLSGRNSLFDPQKLSFCGLISYTHGKRVTVSSKRNVGSPEATPTYERRKSTVIWNVRSQRNDDIP